MKAIQIAQYGGPEEMRLVDLPRPVAGPGQVLVKVVAAGVNPVDGKLRQGYLRAFFPIPLPAVMGCELTGTVAAVGEGVTEFKVGDDVQAGTGMTGAYAEFAVLTPDKLVLKPAILSYTEAAGVPIAGSTAIAALDAAGVQKGSRVLIHAAAGGVGSMTLQIAKARGAHVTAAGSAPNLDYLKSLGADQVVDRSTAYESRLDPFDAVINGADTAAEERSWKLIKKGGVLINLAAPPSEDAAAKHGFIAKTVFGSTNAANIAAANAYIAEGKAKVTVFETYPLRDAAAAVSKSDGGTVRGKLIITI